MHEQINELLKLENIEQWLLEHPDDEHVVGDIIDCPIAVYLSEKLGSTAVKLYVRYLEIKGIRYHYPTRYYNTQEIMLTWLDDNLPEYYLNNVIKISNKELLELAKEIMNGNQ